MGVEVASYSLMVAKTSKQTSQWRNFCIQTLIPAILMLMEIFLCVDLEKKRHDYVAIFYHPKNVV